MEFNTKIIKGLKYGYSKDKRYEYQRTIIIVPQEIARKLEKGQNVEVLIKV